MANYFWITGGSSFAYDEDNGGGFLANWSSTSGGPHNISSSSPPGNSDDLFFDSNSGGNTPTTMPSSANSLTNTIFAWGGSIPNTTAGLSVNFLTWGNTQWCGSVNTSATFSGSSDCAADPSVTLLTTGVFNDNSNLTGGRFTNLDWNSQGSLAPQDYNIEVDLILRVFQSVSLSNNVHSLTMDATIYPQHHNVSVSIGQLDSSSHFSINQSQLPVPLTTDLRQGVVVDAVTGTFAGSVRRFVGPK